MEPSVTSADTGWTRRGGRAVIALALGAALAFLPGCSRQNPGLVLPPRSVSAATVTTKDVPHYLDGLGQITAYEAVSIVTQVDGQIVAMPFTQGSTVKKGDLLAVVYQAPYEAALQQSRGQLASDEATLKLAQKQLDRSRPLLSGNLVSQQQFDGYAAMVDQLKGKVDVDQGQMKVAQINLDYTTVRAPIDGMVGTFLVNLGNVIKNNDQVITTIQRMDPIYADFTVSVSDFPDLRAHFDQDGGKLPVQVSNLANPDLSREGSLTILGNAVASSTGTVTLRATLANADRLFWPNDPVRVRVFLDTLKNAVLVPESAVQLSQQGEFVYVIVPPAAGAPAPTVEKRIVQTGQSLDDGSTVIASGLAGGELVVVHGQIFLAPGSPVFVSDLDGQSVASQTAIFQTAPKPAAPTVSDVLAKPPGNS
jgi:multidrug efflux system membrane fusion protein